jgi:AAA family ATP:ADP antiporter
MKSSGWENDPRLSPLERVLRAFTRIKPEEGATSLMLLASIFLILTAYYLIKPVREGWLSVSVIQGLSKLEVKAYSAFGQTVLLLLIVPIYARLAALVNRRRLINRVGYFFIVILLVFWLLQPGFITDRVPYAGVGFYLFVGIFSVGLVAQFWAFASDLYGLERGRRLFPLIAVGAASGAVVGSWIGERMVRLEWLEAFDLILVSLLPLAAAIWLATRADRRGAYGHPSQATQDRWHEPAAPVNEGAFSQIMKHRYLTAAALMMLVFNWVVASGDNLLFGLVQKMLESDLTSGTVIPGTPEFSRLLKNATTAFYGDLYFWINLLGLFLQAFIVSRLVEMGGFRLLVLTTPFISLAAYVSMAVAPVLAIIKAVKIAENSSNYSIQNTARHMLWLPTTKAMLYQAKPAVDTFFVRFGDGLAAATVLIGTRLLGLTLLQFVYINIGLVVIWIFLSVYIGREHRRMRLAQQQVKT